MATTTNAGRNAVVATGQTVVKGDRLYISTFGVPPTVSVAGAGAEFHGVALTDASAGEFVSMKLRNDGGTMKMRAAGAITAGALVYGAASGEIDDTASGEPIGIALEAATAADQFIEVLDWSAGTENVFQTLNDTNDNEVIEFGATTSAVNHVKVTNAATSGTPSIASHGSDTNVSLAIGVRGAGDITITSGDDLTLKTGTAASDICVLQAYDVNDSAYDTLVTLTAGNSPTLAFAADGGITIGSDVTLSDGVDFAANATTGTKIGTAGTQKLGFFGVTPVVRPTALTQTYSTADATLGTLTGTVITDTTGGSAATNLSICTITTALNNFSSLAAKLNAVIADHADLAQFVNSAVDKLQSLGLLQ